MKTICRSDTEVRKHTIIYRENVDDLTFKLLYVGELAFVENWDEEPHTHSFCEILFITQGSGNIKLNGETYGIAKGDFIFYNANVEHSEHTKSGFSFVFFCR